ncbi:hypothetical protein COB64_02925 [Candidatus Wolfebacteria bacterium]|nr:MAG: hypothetical protein COB64_02925 [Candidatus Wolfebacteria bacterium]
MIEVTKGGDESTKKDLACEITLPNGKYWYVGIDSTASFYAKKEGLECKTVRYFGDCSDWDINERAHKGLPIQVNETNVEDFIDKIATQGEIEQYIELRSA